MLASSTNGEWRMPQFSEEEEPVSDIRRAAQLVSRHIKDKNYGGWHVVGEAEHRPPAASEVIVYFDRNHPMKLKLPDTMNGFPVRLVATEQPVIGPAYT